MFFQISHTFCFRGWRLRGTFLQFLSKPFFKIVPDPCFRDAPHLCYIYAVSIWQDKRDKLRVVYEKNLSENGFEQIVVLTKYFSWLVVNEKSFSKFLLSLDSFLMTEDATREERKEYDAILFEIYKMFESAYKTGLSDNTVRDIGSFQDFYFAATQSLISLSQRLTMRGNVGFDDVSLHDKVKLLVNMFTTYLSNEK